MKENYFKNFSDIDSLDLFIKEIEEDLDSKRYLSALHLALSIPDMLGQLLYPNLKSGKDCYIAWYDNHVKDTFGKTPHDSFYEEVGWRHLDGTIVYQLRCSLFHDGSNDVEKKTKTSEFVISFGDESYSFGNIASTDDEGNFKYLYINAKEFCCNLVNAAKDFRNQYMDLNYPKLKINHGGGHFDKKWFGNK